MYAVDSTSAKGWQRILVVAIDPSGGEQALSDALRALEPGGGTVALLGCVHRPLWWSMSGAAGVAAPWVTDDQLEHGVRSELARLTERVSPTINVEHICGHGPLRPALKLALEEEEFSAVVLGHSRRGLATQRRVSQLREVAEGHCSDVRVAGPTGATTAAEPSHVY